MTGPKGDSEFCFPETLSIPRNKAKGDTEVEGKQSSLFPPGPVINCFVIPPNSKIEKENKKLQGNRLLDLAGTRICRGFKEHDLIKCESKVQVVVSLGS